MGFNPNTKHVNCPHYGAIVRKPSLSKHAKACVKKRRK